MIKVGQFLSARADVLPPEITEELAGLQDEVPAEDFSAIRQRAETLQFVEQHAFGTRDERGHDPEAGLFMQDAIEAFVGETSGLVARRSAGGYSLVPGRDRAGDP